MADGNAATNRREFLGGVAILGAMAGLAETAAGTSAAAAAEDAAATAAGFAKWLDSIRGKHRQVFDAPEPNGGMALVSSYVFLLTGPEAYAVPESEFGVVVVLRHNAIPIAFADGLWSKYKLGEVFKIADPATHAPATRNFFVNSKPGELALPDAAVDKLVSRGVRVGVCGAALAFYSGTVAKQMGLPPVQVRKEWISGVLPGIQVVPSGVVAVNGAQARGCGYCFTG